MKRKTFSILFALVLALSLSLVTAVPVGAQINRLVPSQYATIQDAVNAANPGDTIIVAAGFYDEQVVIDKSLTLQGVGDTTVIQPPAVELTPTPNIPWIAGATPTMAAIVSVETIGGTVIIKDLKIDGSLIPTKSTTWVGGLVYLETSGKVEGVTVIGNSALPDRTAGIFAAAVANAASLEITGCTVEVYTRAGIYALGEMMTADYHHNVINGPGPVIAGVPNGMFFLEGATGSATYNTITNLAYTGETYKSTGIGTYTAGTPITFAYNTIFNVQNAFALSNDTDGTIVEYNNIFDNHTGVRIESRALNSIIRYNDIHHNTYAMRCSDAMGAGNAAHNNNFVDNIGIDAGLPDYMADVSVRTADAGDPQATLDATNNWWGHASGPYHATTNPTGTGDSVSDHVNYDSWLTAEVGSATVGLTGEMPQIVAISVDPTSIDFGTLYPGDFSDQITLTISNIGTVDAGVSTLILDAAGVPAATGDFFWDNLHLFPAGYSATKAHAYTTGPLLVGRAAATPLAQVVVPPNYAAVGTVTGTLVFVATGP